MGRRLGWGRGVRLMCGKKETPLQGQEGYDERFPLEIIKREGGGSDQRLTSRWCRSPPAQVVRGRRYGGGGGGLPVNDSVIFDSRGGREAATNRQGAP